MSSADKYFSRAFFRIVELLDAAQDILKSNANLQAVINEAADLAKELTELKKAHSEELEKRDLSHASALNLLTGQVKALGDNLAEVTKNSTTQQKKLTDAVRVAEQNLAAHMDEITAMHDHVLGKISSQLVCFTCLHFSFPPHLTL